MKTIIIAALFALNACVAMADSLYPLEQGKYPQSYTFFNDDRARKVGDPLTVIIAENATGKVSADAKADASSDVTGVVGGPAGNIAHAFGLLGGKTNSGSGSIDRTDVLNATMTVRITNIYNNGVMKIEGTRSVENNGQVESLKLSGFIRAQDIGADNSIQSRMIANADISYTGKPVQHHRFLFGFIPI